MKWHKFTHPMTNSSIAIKLALEYGPACIAAGRPADYAILSSDDKEARTSTIYFPPSVANLLQFCPEAVPCEKPNPESVSVLHGERRSLALLFPKP